MEKLEVESKRRTRKNTLQHAILGAVAVTGVLSVALLAPNALKILGLKNFTKWSRQKEGINRARKRLVEHGLLKYDNHYLQLTPKGIGKLRQLERHNFNYKKPKKWDGKWRVLIFDIPESQKVLRDKVRLTLQSIGFIKLQNSVWIFPYDCENLIALLKVDFRIGKNLLYLIVESLENDNWIRTRFNLK